MKKNAEKRKCIRITKGHSAGVVMRGTVSFCQPLVDNKQAVYVSKGTMRSFLNQYRKSMKAFKIAAREGITDWNNLPKHCAIANFGTGVLTLYVTEKGVNALDSLKRRYTATAKEEEAFEELTKALEALQKTLKETSTKDKEKREELKNEIEPLKELIKLKIKSRTNIGTHYFIEKAKNHKNEKSISSNNTDVVESESKLSNS